MRHINTEQYSAYKEISRSVLYRAGSTLRAWEDSSNIGLSDVAPHRPVSEHDKEDILHDSLIEFLSGDAPPADKDKRYFGQTVKYHKKSFVRAMGKDCMPTAQIDTLALPAAECGLEAKDVRDVVKTALSRRQYQAVSLKAEGYSTSEIADELGVGSRAVVGLLHRAKTALREQFSR